MNTSNLKTTSVLSNVSKHEKVVNYAVAVIILVILITVLGSTICYVLHRTKTSKEEYLFKSYQQTIFDTLRRDLELIFVQPNGVNNQKLLNTYEANSTNIADGFVLRGTLLHVTKVNKTLVIDLLPLINTIHDILDRNFYYQISLNNNILATNSLDAKFIEQKYIIGRNITLSTKLLAKTSSKLFKELDNIYLRQIKIMFIGSVICLVIFLPFALFIVKKKRQYSRLIKQLYALNEALELNLQYIRSCYFEDENSSFPISLCPKDKVEDFDVNKFIVTLNKYAAGYTVLYQYNFQLTTESSIGLIHVKCGAMVMEQILISLFHNMLYFMRGGTHTKKIIVSFTNDHIEFTYDSFLANESHMENWSKDIFRQTGNLYILETAQIFELIKKCNLSYEVQPKQGENRVIVRLNQMNQEDNIVRFSKKKS